MIFIKNLKDKKYFVLKLKILREIYKLAIEKITDNTETIIYPTTKQGRRKNGGKRILSKSQKTEIRECLINKNPS